MECRCRDMLQTEICSENCETSYGYSYVFCRFWYCQLPTFMQQGMTALIFSSVKRNDSQNDSPLPTILNHSQNVCTIQMLFTAVMPHCQMTLLTNCMFPEHLSQFCNRISHKCVALSTCFRNSIYHTLVEPNN
jgi:hypothetical protein